MLYTAIAEFAGLSDNKSTVLDVCCGTGTIGMVLSKASCTVLWSQWSSAGDGLVPKSILYILSSIFLIHSGQGSGFWGWHFGVRVFSPCHTLLLCQYVPKHSNLESELECLYEMYMNITLICQMMRIGYMYQKYC